MSEIEYIEPQLESTLYSDVCQIIDGARSRIATCVNTEACLTNWYVGRRIKEDVLYNKRAEYGKQVVKNLSIKLTERYGNSWSEKSLRHCLRSAETFSEEDIVSATQRQLTWTHLKSLMYIKNPLERLFYAQMCSVEHWDTRTLNEKIDKQLYQQTALSRRIAQQTYVDQLSGRMERHPDKPRHPRQKYLLTVKGTLLYNELIKN